MNEFVDILKPPYLISNVSLKGNHALIKEMIAKKIEEGFIKRTRAE